ncbi:hypothetical protein MMC13_007670 [Lambiella insularis]|nr:hypothetical protein [Lambiella insularis]
MRLLHTETLQFEEFFDKNTPPYAILSHRWQDKETSFHEFPNDTKKHKGSSSKIWACCQFARSRSFDWVWIDTCCIDKRSSAELSDAINSMYHWYARASECYAYLFDVVLQENEISKYKQFRDSTWFTRGWTLQELLAPLNVIFLDCQWQILGTRYSRSAEISTVTGIATTYVQGTTDAREASIAQRMSWASNRSTSRVEDMAYSLMGLFNVNMPLLYGEGRKAFLRLQLEIIHNSDDESIFAWTSKQRSSGLLAFWPSCFSGSKNIIPSLTPSRPYRMTRTGIEFPVMPLKSANSLSVVGTKFLELNCWDVLADGNYRICLSLHRTKRDAYDIWHRMDCSNLKPVYEHHEATELFERSSTEHIHVHQVEHICVKQSDSEHRVEHIWVKQSDSEDVVRLPKMFYTPCGVAIRPELGEKEGENQGRGIQEQSANTSDAKY